MTEEEQERYDAYNKYYGNRDYLFDLNSIPTGSGGFGYTIPTDALSDPQFAKMIREAEKYLGVPYGLSIIVEMDGILEDVQQMNFVLTVRRYLHRKQNRET